jgi:hypothetical protein
LVIWNAMAGCAVIFGEFRGGADGDAIGDKDF